MTYSSFQGSQSVQAYFWFKLSRQDLGMWISKPERNLPGEEHNIITILFKKYNFCSRYYFSSLACSVPFPQRATVATDSELLVLRQTSWMCQLVRMFCGYMAYMIMSYPPWNLKWSYFWNKLELVWAGVHLKRTWYGWTVLWIINTSMRNDLTFEY